MINTFAIEVRLSELRSKYERGRGKLALLLDQKSERDNALKTLRADVRTWSLVQVLLAKASEYARTQLKTRIEETVTAALRGVISDDLSFRIVLGDRANQPTAEWEVVSCYGDTQIANSPEDARGGGIVDVVSIALRLALMELARPKPGGPLILDEPGKMISAEYAPNLARFLQEYARKTGRQVLMVTHNDALAEVADRSYRVSMSADGVSEVMMT
jgi:DNA repair exonuclease SbcCD ATPase subunit